MTKLTFVLLIGALLAFGCTKKSGSGGSTTTTSTTSSFDITINGHTYSGTNTKGVSNGVSVGGITTTLGQDSIGHIVTIFDLQMNFAKTNSVSVLLGGIKKDVSTGTGIYKSGVYSGSSGGVASYKYHTTFVTDNGDGGKVYQSVQDTMSTINVTINNSTEIKGSFSLRLLYNGTVYPATGNFDFMK